MWAEYYAGLHVLGYWVYLLPSSAAWDDYCQFCFFTYSLVFQYVVGSVRVIFAFNQCAREFIALLFVSIYRANSMDADEASSKGNRRKCRPDRRIRKIYVRLFGLQNYPIIWTGFSPDDSIKLWFLVVLHASKRISLKVITWAFIHPRSLRH